MATPQKYFHDKLVLLLISVNSFLVLMLSALVLLRLDGGKSGSYITQYRENLGLSAFERGGVLDLAAFVIFVLGVFVLHILVSKRVYPWRRSAATAVLTLSVVLIIFSIVVSNALLILR